MKGAEIMSFDTSSSRIAAGTTHAVPGTARAAAVLKAAWAALTIGSRAIPLGDNGELFRELAARIAILSHRN